MNYLNLDRPRLHKKGPQSRINVTDNIFKGSAMSISLREVLENPKPTIDEVISRRLKGVSRGLGFWAAWDAAPKVGYRREAVKKKLSQ